MSDPEECFVAVHSGAGFHHLENDKRTKRALRLACKKALERVKNENSNANKSLTLVEQAVISLEDDPYLNAGYGSNLTLDGTVECDAALHASFSGSPSDQGNFGSVGAVSGIKNPVSAARSILEYSRKSDKLGRVPPMTLVSNGATNFVQEYGTGMILVPPEDMITSLARQTWKKWKDRLVEQESMTDEVEKGNIMQDTVGAVAWHSIGGFASGVSSGGILLKFPGRVGEAAIFGAGCWAQHQVGSPVGMACSISGTGEEIVRANLARSIGEAYRPATEPLELLQRTLVERFWEPAKRRGINNPAVGVLMITREPDEGRTRLVRFYNGEYGNCIRLEYRSKAKGLYITSAGGNRLEGGESTCVHHVVQDLTSNAGQAEEIGTTTGKKLTTALTESL